MPASAAVELSHTCRPVGTQPQLIPEQHCTVGQQRCIYYLIKYLEASKLLCNRLNRNQITTSFSENRKNSSADFSTSPNPSSF